MSVSHTYCITSTYCNGLNPFVTHRDPTVPNTAPHLKCPLWSAYSPPSRARPKRDSSFKGPDTSDAAAFSVEVKCVQALGASF